MFDVAATSYRAFMGRYSEPLAVVFADQAGIGPRTGTALDVGCGPGALTTVLVERLGAAQVAAVDPSEPFVAATRQRFPDVEVRQAVAEDLPFADHRFDATLAELVVHFMSDPVAGLVEMRRVTRPGGTVAACVWDFAGEAAPLSTYWAVLAEIDPSVENEAGLAGAGEGRLLALAAEAGLSDAQQGYLTVTSRYAAFEEWWEPYTLGVGPAGAALDRLDDDQRAAVRARCAELLPSAPFEVSASAWSIVAQA